MPVSLPAVKMPATLVLKQYPVAVAGGTKVARRDEGVVFLSRFLQVAGRDVNDRKTEAAGMHCNLPFHNIAGPAQFIPPPAGQGQEPAAEQPGKQILQFFALGNTQVHAQHQFLQRQGGAAVSHEGEQFLFQSGCGWVLPRTAVMPLGKESVFFAPLWVFLKSLAFGAYCSASHSCLQEIKD